MEYDINVTKKSAIDMINKLRDQMPEVNRMCLKTICLEIVKRSQRDYLTGGHPLNVRSGTLRQGMWYKIDSPSTGQAQVGNNVKYAKVHESENISDRTIVPKKAKYLFIPLSAEAKKRGRVQTRSRTVITAGGRMQRKEGMKWGEDFIFAKKVVMPHRPFIRPAIDDVMKGNVINRIIDESLKRQFERLEKDAE